MNNTVTITVESEHLEAILSVMTDSYLRERTLRNFDEKERKSMEESFLAYREAMQEEIDHLKDHITLLKQNIEALTDEAKREVSIDE